VSEAPNLCLLASAGTGKTYRLTNRFLALLFEGVEPDRILATTFTRKAAGEILDRVLSRLVEACESPAKRDELATAIELDGLDEDRCRDLLASLTRKLNAFQVRTIDSFFVHLVQLFALDLELPPDWRLCDDRVDKRLRSAALQEILGEQDPEQTLILLRELSKGDIGRSVHDTLLEKTGRLRHIHLECADGGWDQLSVPACPEDEELAASLAMVEGAPLPENKGGGENANWKKARATFLGRVRDGRWEELVGSGLGLYFLGPERVYSSKPFPEEMVPAMEVIMARTRHEILGRLRRNNLAAAALLESFEEAFQRKKREEGAFGFSDLPYALAPRTSRAMPLDERELDRWFRLDGRIDHLLLDEFQDTSPVQWRILESIAREIVAEGGEGRSLFCVGDVKQSIYSFRQAEPRLLAELVERMPGLEKDEMNKSFRSSRIVLETVNHVFGGLATNTSIAREGLEPYQRAAERWATSFPPHEAAKEFPGAAFVVEARAPEEGERNSAPLLECTLDRVQRILADCPTAKVGVLLRKNKDIARLIYSLREKEIDASGEGGNPLTDTPAVLVYLSLLQLIDHPDDSAAHFHLATSPFGDKLNPEAEHSERRLFAGRLRAEFQGAGLAEFTRGYAARVAKGNAWTAWDKARFAQLLDEAYAFEGQGEPRPSAFIDHIYTKNVESPGGARVRVMTIHGSKGLEFDAVVLPELSGGLIGQRGNVLVDRPDPTGAVERASVAPNKKLLPASTELRELYNEATERMVEDSLSVLYVAMTRAKRRLDLVMPPPKDRKKPGIPETHEFIRAALAEHGLHEPDDDGVLWSHPDNAPGSDWAADLEIPAEQSEPQSAKDFGLAPSNAPRSLTSRSPSHEEGGGKRTAKEALRSSRGAKVGTLVHACLESLVWVERGFEPEGGREWQRSGEGLREQARELLERGLNAPPIRQILTEATCGAPEGLDLEVCPEEPFVTVLTSDEGEQELWTGSIDRLVLGRRDGDVVWAQVIDYKTDRAPEGGLDELEVYYQPQLRRYVQLVSERFGLEPASITAQLLFMREGEVRNVD
jgi:ATP-dependent helicase/nuclease subunit A